MSKPYDINIVAIYRLTGLVLEHFNMACFCNNSLKRPIEELISQKMLQSQLQPNHNVYTRNVITNPSGSRSHVITGCTQICQKLTE